MGVDMGVRLDEVAVLASLGLTGRQARVYLALLKTGELKAKAVAEIALVNRQEVYRILDSLQHLGLIQQNIDAPTSFTAIPIAEGVRLLLQQKASELTLMSKKANWLTKKLSLLPIVFPTATAVVPKQCFGEVAEGDRGKKYLQAIQETQSAIEAVTSWLRFKQQSFLFETQLKNLLKKDINLNVITEKPANHHLPKWVSTALSKYPNFNLKTQLNTPLVSVTLFDHTQAAIAFNPNTPITRGPTLWTTHPALTTLCQAYYNATLCDQQTNKSYDAKMKSPLLSKVTS